MNYLKSLISIGLDRKELLLVSSSLGLSLLIAEFFFHFGSFTAECLAFLGVWHVLFKTAKFFSKK